MHPDNVHNGSYDFPKLLAAYPMLKEYVFTNEYDTQTIKFSNPKAVKALNTALLKAYHNIDYWEFSDQNLCPPIPSRADYLYYLHDLLRASSFNAKPTKILDIGTGASCIYPLLGNALFDWHFVASDIAEKTLESAQNSITKNKLETKIILRKQTRKKHILTGVIQADDFFFATLCNPPFYKSKEEAIKTNLRKLRNLKINTKGRNFGGNANELWYKGGEVAFIKNYSNESVQYQNQVYWFTSLVSQGKNLPLLYKHLAKIGAKTVKTITMEQGHKITRFIAWRFE